MQVVGVHVRHQHRGGAGHRLGLGEDARVEDHHVPLVLDPDAGVAELRDPHVSEPREAPPACGAGTRRTALAIPGRRPGTLLPAARSVLGPAEDVDRLEAARPQPVAEQPDRRREPVGGVVRELVAPVELADGLVPLRRWQRVVTDRGLDVHPVTRDRAHRVERQQRVAQVVEHAPEEDHVERLTIQAVREVVDAGAEELCTRPERRRDLVEAERRGRVDVDGDAARGPAPFGLEDGGTVGGADVENRPACQVVGHSGGGVEEPDVTDAGREHVRRELNRWCQTKLRSSAKRRATSGSAVSGRLCVIPYLLRSAARR